MNGYDSCDLPTQPVEFSWIWKHKDIHAEEMKVKEAVIEVIIELPEPSDYCQYSHE